MRIITGMHRSGTSLIANLFYEAGVDMGDPGTFYRPDQWNPEGYYEQPDIHQINMPLINGIFWKFSYFWLPSEELILRRAKKFEPLIRQMAEKYQDSVVKETRYCLTLPAWLKYDTSVDRVLICLREPIQVARSIQKRNHTILGHGYYLWREHNQRILKYTESIPTWFINYHAVLNPETCADELDAAFRFMGYEQPKEKIETLMAKLVKPGMNHNKGDENVSYPDDIRLMWEDLQERHRTQTLSNFENEN